MPVRVKKARQINNLEPCSDSIGTERALALGISGMNAIDLVLTVCAVLSPTTCEERHLVFSSEVSPRQCVMAAQPYIAQWVSEHPKWTAVRWRCEYPHANDKADKGDVMPTG
jgi:hypothetical protein